MMTSSLTVSLPSAIKDHHSTQPRSTSLSQNRKHVGFDRSGTQQHFGSTNVSTSDGGKTRKHAHRPQEAEKIQGDDRP